MNSVRLCLLMSAWPCLKWCVICGVHDRKPVLAEGGAVRPSEVSHDLGTQRKWLLRNEADICFKTNEHIFFLIIIRIIIRSYACRNVFLLKVLSYLDTVPHVLFAGLLLQHFGGKL